MVRKKDELGEFEKEKRIVLKGFTSTSFSSQVAVTYALQNNNEDDQVSILLKIKFKGRSQYFYLNSKDFSAYPDEEEVLIQDGVEFKVLKVEE